MQSAQMSKPEISKDMTIGEFVQNYPELVEILMAEGVHCVGCGAAHYETIEQGLLGHGKTPERVDKLIEELKEAHQTMHKKPEEQHEGLKVTDKAAEKIKELLTKQGEDIKGLRVSVMPGGCSGMQYYFDWEKEKRNDDVVLETQGVTFFVDDTSLELINGSTLDFSESLTGGGFKMDNPNAKKSCGCGKSFS